jgi:hypothetical protein
MSIKLIEQVWEAEVPGGRDVSGRLQKLVLLALADHANDDGTNVYPSIGRIVWKTGCSEMVVHRAIKSFLRLGVLKDEGWSEIGTKLYSLHLDRLKKQPSFVAKASKDKAEGSMEAILPESRKRTTPRKGYQTDTPSDGKGRGINLTGRGINLSEKGCQTDTRTVSITVSNNHQKSSKKKKNRKRDKNQKSTSTSLDAESSIPSEGVPLLPDDLPSGASLPLAAPPIVSPAAPDNDPPTVDRSIPDGCGLTPELEASLKCRHGNMIWQCEQCQAEAVLQ